MDDPFAEIDLKELKQRDPRAVAGWVRIYGDPLYTFVFYRVGRNADDAADVVQETFLKAFRQIEDYDPQRGSMLAWLTYLSKNIIKKALRARRRHLSYDQAWQGVDASLRKAYGLIATEPLPEDVLESQETAELVRMTLGSIPGNYKRVLTEHYYRQMPLKEIAAALGVSEGVVKALVYRARQAFKVAFVRLSKFPKDTEPAIEVSHE